MITESQTQTFISAWPGRKDRRTPKWLASPSAYYAGILGAISLAIMLRIAVLTRATCFGLYTICTGGCIVCWGCGVLTRIPGQLGLQALYVRVFRDMWENRCLLFTCLAGSGFALASVLSFYSIWIIGLAYTTVSLIAGGTLTCMLVDYYGIGWNQRKVIRAGHIQGSILLILGASFLQFDLFVSPQLLNLTSSTTSYFASTLAAFAGSLFTMHNVALAELCPLLTSRARGLTFSFIRFLIYFAAFAYLFLPDDFRTPVIPLHRQELWIMIPLGSITLSLALLSSHVAANEGNTLFNLKFWASFSVTAFIITALGWSSLPPRNLDISHLIGLAFVITAVIIGRNASKTSSARQLKYVPNRRHGDDHCDICIKNDLEISRIQRELQHKSELYDDTVVIANAS